MSRHGLLLAVLIALASSACLPEDDLPVAELLRRCDGRHLKPCDILEDGCQRDYLEYVACLRDEPPGELPSIREISMAEREAEVRQRYAPEDIQRFDSLGRGLALIDLYDAPEPLSESLVQIAVGTVPAYYDTETSQITLVRGAMPSNPEIAVRALAHEVTHALQDRAFDLDFVFDTYVQDNDSELAVRSAIEGDAELYERMVDFALDRRSVWNADWDGYFSAREGATYNWVEADASPVLVSDRSFPYAFGGRFMTDAWLAGQTLAVRHLVAYPPVSTAKIMAGYGAVEPPRGWVEPIVGEPELPPPLVGYAPAFGLVLGRWHVEILLRRLGDRREAARVAQHWRADHLWIYREPSSDRHAIVWALRFDDATHGAEPFVAAIGQRLQDGPPTWRVKQGGRDLVLVAAELESELPSWQAAGAALLP